MCMKNVNINSIICSDAKSNDSGGLTVYGVSDIIYAKKDSDSENYVSNFSIMTFVNMVERGTEEEKFPTKYECSVRIMPTDNVKDVTELVRISLDENIRTCDKNDFGPEPICKDFAENRFITTLNNFHWKQLGKYALFILIREKDIKQNVDFPKSQTQFITVFSVMEEP